MSGAHFLRGGAPLDSPLRRLPAAIKLLGTGLFVTGLALVPASHVEWMGFALAVVVVLVGISRVPFSAFVARLALAQPFVLGVAILALFQHRGLVVFGALALKSTVCVAAVQLLAHTTPFHDVLEALRRARVPGALVLALALLERYLGVVVEESRRMQRARTARGWRKSSWSDWRNLASVIAVSFVRSLTRAERISVAMRARGWS